MTSVAHNILTEKLFEALQLEAVARQIESFRINIKIYLLFL